ncbi:hypothetical protein HG537_0B00480 [Torulaspora globosa]|uniref:Mitochondrial inner membrane i-AAA protease complex subunit MGR1 n=1 Tax=Torulaspora globosa TaxID=48254 RepID=A0A7H9HN65_9SACH|nr:hypothetical protein HG537_0B00480 [Torulaspora sp. CBS 2947]
MALYTPPGRSPARPAAGETTNDKREDSEDDLNKFYVRPSIGLRLWGPLVPASDNKAGLWTLIGIQSAIGLLCMYRIKRLRTSLKTVRKDIADFPSLNRFSTTHGELLISPVSVTPIKATSMSVQNGVQKASYSGAAFGTSSFFKSSSQDSGSGGKFSGFSTFRQVVYLLTGTLLLSQSLLEICRLKLLKYDPWCEEAKSVRDKKFFNDIIRFYHEGIDPTKVRVKDASSGNVMPTNIPEVKQSVALVRAQSEAENPIIKWYGPLEYKPMSFSEYLDKLEYHLDMLVFLQEKRKLKKGSIEVMQKITHSSTEVEQLKRNNRELRKKTYELVSEAPKNSIPRTDRTLTYPTRGILMDADCKTAEDFDLQEMWKLYDPWMSLALDTSLSIKFLPTITGPAEAGDHGSDELREPIDEPESSTK